MSLEVRDLTFAWPGTRPLFEAVGFDLGRGGRLAVLGGNGSGKSTLARCLAGLLPASGTLRWRGAPWDALSRADRAAAVQYVCQRPHLQLSGRALTVREEIAFGPENLGLAPTEVRARVAQAMDLLGLGHLAGRNCQRLSGGETQRVVLAGALAMRPQLLILDEPMTDLDAESRDALVAHLRDLPWKMGLIVLDIGWHEWMDGLIADFLLLDDGRISGPLTAEALFNAPLPAPILLPENLRLLREARGTGRLAERIAVSRASRDSLLARISP